MGTVQISVHINSGEIAVKSSTQLGLVADRAVNIGHGGLNDVKTHLATAGGIKVCTKGANNRSFTQCLAMNLLMLLNTGRVKYVHAHLHTGIFTP